MRNSDSQLYEYLKRKVYVREEDFMQFNWKTTEQWINELGQLGILSRGFLETSEIVLMVNIDAIFAAERETQWQEKERMKWKIEEGGGYEPIVIPEGVYPAKVASIVEKEMQFGPTVILNFEVTEGAEKGKVLSGLASAKVNPKTKFGKWVGALGIPLEPNTELKEEDLVGKQCQIVTETNIKTKEDGTHYDSSNVIKVLPSGTP